MILNMHLYKNLAVLSLAASAISPALAAPVVGAVDLDAERSHPFEAELPTRESRDHAHAELNAKRFDLAPISTFADIASGATSLMGMLNLKRSTGSILGRNEGKELDKFTVTRDGPSRAEDRDADRVLGQRDGSDTHALFQALSALNPRTEDESIYSAEDLVAALRRSFSRALNELN